MENNSINPGEYSSAQIGVASRLKKDVDLKSQREKLQALIDTKENIQGDPETMEPIKKDIALLRKQLEAIDIEIETNIEDLLRSLKTIYTI